MKALSVVAGIMVAACVVALGFSHHSVRADTEDLPVIFAASIYVTNADVRPDNPALVQVFIPTDSNSVKCLVSQNDTTCVAFGTQMFCALRHSSVFGSGVAVTIDYFQTVPPNYGTSFTLWQEGARNYGPPVPCTTAGAC